MRACDETDDCDLWVKTTFNRKCYLQGATTGTGLLNDFRNIANWIIDGMLVVMMNGIMKKACHQMDPISFCEFRLKLYLHVITLLGNILLQFCLAYPGAPGGNKR